MRQYLRLYVFFFLLIFFCAGSVFVHSPHIACAACASPSFSLTTVDNGNYAPNTIRFGDIDGDGDKDIVTGSSASAGDLSYYLNNGSGSYGVRVGLSSTQESQYQIELSDVDGDSDIDIVSADRYGENVKWYENNGGLSFTERTIASGLATDSVYDVAVGDLDGDTDIDVIVAIGGATDDVAWYRNNGDDTFTTMTAVDSNLPGAYMLDAGDMDDDGDVDVLAMSAESGGGASYYLNNGSGSFTETSLTTSPRANGRIVDLDSDGDKDLLVIAQNAIYWYARSGGTFGAAQTIGSGSYLFIGLDTKDIDGDGDMDFATSEYSNAGGSWWKNNGSQSFSEQIVASTGYFYDLDVEDITSDSNPDIVFAAMNPDNDVLLYIDSCNPAPTVSTLSPADNATGVSPSANLVITFSETVTVGSGNIVIKKSSDNSIIETISVEGGLVTGGGTDTITINPSTTLAELTSYYVTVDSTAFVDSGSAAYAGISNATTWNFTTGDITNPTVSTLSPADNATGVSPTANLVITFSENVVVAAGNVTIKKSSDNSTVETLSIVSELVSGSGTTIITINPATTLSEQTSYYVTIDAPALDDSSGNSYAGISDTTTWNFTIGDFTAPTLLTLSPSDNSTGAFPSGALTITFSEVVSTSTGNIVIKKSSDNSIIETIAANSAQVMGSGTSTLVIDPLVALAHNTSYYVTIASDAITDSSTNAFAGISDATAWNFTTKSSSSSSPSSSSTTSNTTSSPTSTETSTATAITTIDTSGALRVFDYSITHVQAIREGDFLVVTWDAGVDVRYVTLRAEKQGSSEILGRNIPHTGRFVTSIPSSWEGSSLVIAVDVTDLLSTLATGTSKALVIPSEETTSEVTPSPNPDEISAPSEPSSFQEEYAGSYIKGLASSTIYFVTENYYRRPFPTTEIFFTYANSFNDIIPLSENDLRAFPLGKPMLPRAEAVLVKIQSDPRVYTLTLQEDGETVLHWIPNEQTAQTLYGISWADYVIDIDSTLFTKFILGEAMTGIETVSHEQLRPRASLILPL